MNIKNCWQQKGKVEDLRDVVILHDCELVNGASSKDREINCNGDKMQTTVRQPLSNDPGENWKNCGLY